MMLRQRPTRRRSLAFVGLGCAAALMLTACSTTQTTPNVEQPQSSVDPGTDGPGVTDDTVTVAFADVVGWQQLDAANKASAIAARDAVVDAFNEAGGIAGRDVVVLDDYPAAAVYGERQDALAQSQGLPVSDPSDGAEVCDAFAAGTPVLANLGSDLIASPLGTPAAAACLNAQGIINIGATAGWTTDDFTAAPATAGPGVSIERLGDALVAAASDAGFDPGAPTALISETSESAETVTGYQEALKNAGFADLEPILVSASSTDAEALNVALRLKNDGVSQIVYAPGSNSSVVAQLTVPALQTQQFFPKQLAIDTSVTNPGMSLDQAMLDSIASYAVTRSVAGLTPQQQDLVDATPGGELCATASANDPSNANFVSLNLCDGLELLKAALEAEADAPLNTVTFTEGLNGLGDSVGAATAFATNYDEGQHDGAAAVVRTTFDPSCMCELPGDKTVGF